MDFNEQVKWIEDKISELREAKAKNEELTKKIKSDIAIKAQKDIADKMQSDINALVTILHGYKKAQKDSVNLSWTEYPDRMGR